MKTGNSLIDFLMNLFTAKIEDDKTGLAELIKSRNKSREVTDAMSYEEKLIEIGREEGREKGREEGREEGIISLLKFGNEMRCPKALVINRICTDFGLTLIDAESYYKKYSRE